MVLRKLLLLGRLAVRAEGEGDERRGDSRAQEMPEKEEDSEQKKKR